MNTDLLKCIGIASLTVSMLWMGHVRADDSSDHAQFQSQFHAAMEACRVASGLGEPTPGQPPSDADRKLMDACMSAKGFTRPPGPPPEEGGHHHGPPPEDSFDSSSNNSPQ